MDIGNNIKHCRKKRRMTQEQLAEVSDLSASYISQLESGRRCASIPVMEKIAQALDVTTSFLVYVESEEQSQRNDELQALISDCTEDEWDIIYGTLIQLKSSLKSKRGQMR